MRSTSRSDSSKQSVHTARNASRESACCAVIESKRPKLGIIGMLKISVCLLLFASASYFLVRLKMYARKEMFLAWGIAAACTTAASGSSMTVTSCRGASAVLMRSEI